MHIKQRKRGFSLFEDSGRRDSIFFIFIASIIAFCGTFFVSLGYIKGGYYVTVADGLIFSTTSMATHLIYPIVRMLATVSEIKSSFRTSTILACQTKKLFWKKISFSLSRKSLIICLLWTCSTLFAALLVANKWEVTDESRNLYVLYAHAKRIIPLFFIVVIFFIRIFLISLLSQQLVLFSKILFNRVLYAFIGVLILCIHDFSSNSPWFFKFVPIDCVSLLNPFGLFFPYGVAILICSILALLNLMIFRKRDIYV